MAWLMRAFKKALGVVVSLWLVSCSQPIPAKPYNFVVILTDDQRWDSLWTMPFLSEHILPQSLNLTNAFMTNPVCCPARASILSGFQPHNTGVLNNSSLNGTRAFFNETDTVPLNLQNAGYKTALIGRYMHGYNPGVVPPGWSYFVGIGHAGQATAEDWTTLKWVTIGSSNKVETRVKAYKDIPQYVSYYQRDKALEFLDLYGKDPFFLYVSTYAPHGPSVPAPEDLGLFSDYLYRSPSYLEEDVRDKPLWLQQWATMLGRDLLAYYQANIRDQLRSLQAVDRMVQAIWERLEQQNLLDHTIFIFTSDNGLNWGEHHLFDKGSAYEESLRVPMLVYMPQGLQGESNKLVAVNLDIAATIYDLAKLPKVTEGLSLVPLLKGEEEDWRKDIMLEAFGYLSYQYPISGVWAGLRSERWKYVAYAEGDLELYDLATDPYELENKAYDPAYQAVLTELAEKVEAQKGLAITVFSLPKGNVNQPYQTELKAWGAQEPYTWSITEGDLPTGLNMDNQGRIQGIPSQSGSYPLVIQVKSPQVASHRGLPQEFNWRYELIIEAE
ncbi:MAG: sulfatase [Deinococcales bacterium]